MRRTRAAVPRDLAPMDDRILSAAYRCFERHGFAKTTIEDIAREASVSRPTVYKYFSGKDDIADRIAIIESLKVNSEVRRRTIRRETFADSLTEALMVVARVATQNPYIRRIAENRTYTAYATTPGAPLHSTYRDLWGGMLRRAMSEAQLAADLELDQIITWLSFVEGPLMAQMDATQTTDDEFRLFIRRFIVEPLLPRAARTSADEDGA